MRPSKCLSRIFHGAHSLKGWSDGEARIVRFELKLYGRRLRTDLIIAIALWQFSVIFKNIEHSVIAIVGDVDMARPATHRLIGADTIGQHRFVNLRE